MHASEVWSGSGLGPVCARAALTPLSWLYAAGWQAYLGFYRLGLKRASEQHSPVVCVGNLMVGGTGKSPLTLHLAEVLLRMGRSVAISASGYGGPRAEAASVAPEGPLSAAEWGDEPAMIRWLLPEVPLVVGRRRVEAARLVHAHFPGSVMLMDDGFQHLPLRKHLTVVLDPATPANRRCLPAGPYREPRWNRARADLVLPGRFEVVERESWFETSEHERVEAPSRYSVLCALGQPDRFLASLPPGREATVLRPDHDPLTAGTLTDGLPADLPIVVTAKDWVKLRDRGDVGERRWVVARHSVAVSPGAAFAAWLEGKLDELGP